MDWTELETQMPRVLEDFNLAGAGIAVVHGGKTVFSNGFGKRDMAADKPMTPDSLFAIGSTTKAMTATVMGMLVDEGKLDWDAPVREYLPWFTLSDPDISRRITVRDLVTHRSGLPRHDALWYNNMTDDRESIIRRLAHVPFSADLRQKFQYNNLMYLTAGFLAGYVSGCTWEALIADRLFKPLGMTRSNFDVAESVRDPDHAEPYREDDDQVLEHIPFRPITLTGPAGCVNSSVNEMTRWIAFNLGDGCVDGTRLINETTLADIQAPQMSLKMPTDRPDVTGYAYGMGWMLGTYRGHMYVEHGGGIDGFITSVMLFPDDDLGLVSFTNAMSGASTYMNRFVADRMLDMDPVDWFGDALTKRKKVLAAAKGQKKAREETRVTGTQPSHSLADYTGEFRDPGYGMLKISQVNGDLQMEYNDITVPLHHWHYNVWNSGKVGKEMSFEGTKVLFRCHVEGHIDAVEIQMESMTDPVVFRRTADARLSDPVYLETLTGTYMLPSDTPVTVEISGDHLTAGIQGQPGMTLQAGSHGRFNCREMPGISVEFVQRDGGMILRLFQENAVIEAKRRA
jgi:CubicO group peptidase (beta-lactamase class C family)